MTDARVLDNLVSAASDAIGEIQQTMAMGYEVAVVDAGVYHRKSGETAYLVEVNAGQRFRAVLAKHLNAKGWNDAVVIARLPR